MTKKRLPKVCSCGCGFMTRGGRFLPGHDAKLKSRLKNEARAGDVAAFDRLVELGWAAGMGDRADYPGVGPVVSPVVLDDPGMHGAVTESMYDSPAPGVVVVKDTSHQKRAVKPVLRRTFCHECGRSMSMTFTHRDGDYEFWKDKHGHVVGKPARHLDDAGLKRVAIDSGVHVEQE